MKHIKQHFILLLSVLLFSCSFLHAKKGAPAQITRLDQLTKKVYVSIEALSTFNFWQNLQKPYGNDGIIFCVTPSIRVDYYLGSYFFFGGGFSYNTTGGKYYFPSSRINDLPHLSSEIDASRRVSVSYIEMPLYIKVQSNYINNWAVQGLIGFSWGVKIRSLYSDVYYNVKYTNDAGAVLFNGHTYTEEGNFGKKASLWNVGALAEIRALYRATEKLQLFVGAGYQAGLTNTLSKKNMTTEDGFHKGKPGQVIVSAGLVF
ncbi:MAG: outer membrane beta-barrel protein [Bacteroidales bacterium]|jgi:hypothetical protein|nr:outer membrane beta-barrel protein [Bacteroidales bacterium]